MIVVKSITKSMVYFDGEGRDYLQQTVDLVVNRLREGDIRHVAVFTAEGEGAELLRNALAGDTAIQIFAATFPPGRFGALDIQQGQVLNFKEKPKGDGAMINGGFFVLTPKVFDYLTDDSTVWEQEPLKNLAADGQLMAYEHHGFWQPMDTLRDKHLLEELWQTGKAPWKIWD